MKFFWLVMPLFFLGCASSQQVQGPNGTSAQLVKCGNAVKEKCVEKAVELCPRGYTELPRSADRYSDTTKVGNIGLLEIRADTTTTMMIQCK